MINRTGGRRMTLFPLGVGDRPPGRGAGDAPPLSAHDERLDETMGRVEGRGNRATPERDLKPR
jgi:hypothetical protein